VFKTLLVQLKWSAGGSQKPTDRPAGRPFSRETKFNKTKLRQTKARLPQDNT